MERFLLRTLLLPSNKIQTNIKWQQLWKSAAAILTFQIACYLRIFQRIKIFSQHREYFIAVIFSVFIYGIANFSFKFETGIMKKFFGNENIFINVWFCFYSFDGIIIKYKAAHFFNGVGGDSPSSVIFINPYGNLGISAVYTVADQDFYAANQFAVGNYRTATLFDFAVEHSLFNKMSCLRAAQETDMDSLLSDFRSV